MLYKCYIVVLLLLLFLGIFLTLDFKSNTMKIVNLRLRLLLKIWFVSLLDFLSLWFREMVPNLFFFFFWYLFIYLFLFFPFATAWMELESIMLSEISQVVRDKYHMISPNPFLWKQEVGTLCWLLLKPPTPSLCEVVAFPPWKPGSFSDQTLFHSMPELWGQKNLVQIWEGDEKEMIFYN